MTSNAPAGADASADRPAQTVEEGPGCRSVDRPATERAPGTERAGEGRPGEDRAERALAAFRGVHERVFVGDPAANPRLAVEVIEVEEVGGVPTLVLVTPWTINGLFFLQGEGPTELEIAGSTRRVHPGDVEPLGAYLSVNLVPDVGRLTSPRQARTLAVSFAGPFRDALRGWLAAGECRSH